MMRAIRAALLLIAVTATAQDPTGGIRGTVVDAITRQPIRKATMRLTALNVSPAGGGFGVVSTASSGRSFSRISGVMAGAGGIHSAVADVGGAFSFDSLAAGKYILTAQHPDYPQSRVERKEIEVAAGEVAGPVTVELMPGSAVSGRVLDDEGDPLIGCFVQPHPAAHPDRGVQYGVSAPNENGEYRLFGMPAGKYIFSVQCHSAPFQPRPFSAGPDPPPSLGYPEQFYPLAADAKSAQQVELAPGAEKSGVDFRLKALPVTQVHGSFSPSGVDWHGLPIAVQLVPADSTVRQQMGARMDNSGKRTFEFRQVFPGSYYVAAFTSGDPETRVAAVQRIEVKDQPVETVLELTHGVDLQGTVEVESGNSSTNPVSFKDLFLQLAPQNLPMLGSPGVQVNEDGTFTIKSAMPGRVRLYLSGPGVFVKSAWLGNTEITDRVFDVAAGELRIVVSTNLATISGTAPPGQMVYVARIDAGGMNGMGMEADGSGHFSLSNLAPGKYRVVAGTPGEPMPEEGGQEISVGEGETVTVEIKGAQ